MWRSRDLARHKITPDVWAQNERFVKAAAKRAPSLPGFIEALKPRMSCATLNPRAMTDGSDPARRTFLTETLDLADAPAVLDRLYHETAWVVLLVRDRLERERPVEAQITRTLALGAAATAAEEADHDDDA